MRLSQLGELGVLAELEQRGLVGDIADDAAMLGDGLVVTRLATLGRNSVPWCSTWQSLQPMPALTCGSVTVALKAGAWWQEEHPASIFEVREWQVVQLPALARAAIAGCARNARAACAAETGAGA